MTKKSKMSPIVEQKIAACFGAFVVDISHRHRAKPALAKVRGYSGPIQGARENRAAHGNVQVIDTCSCGATRRTNVNQGHVERGPWEIGEVTRWA